MTPTPDAVKASALERCIRLVRQGGTDLKGSALAREARAELRALRAGSKGDVDIRLPPPDAESVQRMSDYLCVVPLRVGWDGLFLMAADGMRDAILEVGLRLVEQQLDMRDSDLTALTEAAAKYERLRASRESGNGGSEETQ